MIIENRLIKVEFDEYDGSIISLFNKVLGSDAINDKSKSENFRLSIPLESDWTNIIIGKGCRAKITRKTEESLVMEWEEITVAEKSEKIHVTINAWLNNDELASTVSIVNLSNCKIDYIWYPILGGVTQLGGDREIHGSDDMYIPRFCGVIDRDLYGNDWVDENNRYWYTSREFKSAVYPRSTYMQFVCLSNKRCGLYFNSKDNKDFYTGFYAEHERARTPMTFSIVKAPFIKPGESHTTCENVVSYYEGTWHVAANKYKEWMKTWFNRKVRPQWVKELDGWLAFQGHAGDMHIAHSYDEYPQWLEKAQNVGLNTIHIHCGVHDEGIEGGYPYWTNYSKRMGGKENLLRVINKIHEMGGRVITFTKDNKANLGLPEYEEKFAKHAIKLRDGSSPRVSYCVGTLDMLCSGAQLGIMCRGDKAWQKFILAQMEEIATVGFDGNMIDEWCSGLDLCMSENHGHSKPTDQISGQHELGKLIMDVSLKHNPEYLMAAEEIWDAAYEYMDVSFARGGCSEWWGRDPRFYEIFKFAIPGIQRTAEILENEYPHLNYSLACGSMLILCIDYYHSGPEKYPEFAAYFKEIIRIRGEVRDYFIDGDFRDDLDYRIETDNDLVNFKSYKMGEKELIIIYSQDNNKENSFTINFNRVVPVVKIRQPNKHIVISEDVDIYSSLIQNNSVVVLELLRSH